MALFQMVVAAIGLYVSLAFVRYAGWRFNYDQNILGILDLAQAAAYFGLAILGFSIIPRIWRIEPGVWRTAIFLSLSLAGLAALDVVLSILLGWRITVTDFAGIAAHALAIAYLNTTPVRRLFGRPPMGFLQRAGL